MSASPPPAPSHWPLATVARRGRRAFTLTELLVVIAIIAVLAGMVSVGVMRALDTAKQTRIKTEVDQLDLAFKAYREKYGSYPPCNLSGLAGDRLRLVPHIARAFPRYDMSQLGNDLRQAGLTPNSFRPDQALVFWLKGFSPDPAHPFITANGEQISNGMVPNPGVKVQVTPLFDFDKSRLAVVGPGTVPSYFPQGSKTDTTGAPYVYWDSVWYARPYATVTSPLMWNIADMPFTTNIFVNAGGIRPYGFDPNGNGAKDADEDWANPDSFQIIAAGGDGKYGALTAAKADDLRLFPTGTRYDPLSGDDDNVTNFCPKARLGDSKP